MAEEGDGPGWSTTGVAPRWMKAARSSTLNACVEMARDGDAFLVRDSKAPDVVLAYSRLEMEIFFEGVKNCEFDHLFDK